MGFELGRVLIVFAPDWRLSGMSMKAAGAATSDRSADKRRGRRGSVGH
jgi:hypothetical protein